MAFSRWVRGRIGSGAGPGEERREARTHSEAINVAGSEESQKRCSCEGRLQQQLWVPGQRVFNLLGGSSVNRGHTPKTAATHLPSCTRLAVLLGQRGQQGQHTCTVFSWASAPQDTHAQGSMENRSSTGTGVPHRTCHGPRQPSWTQAIRTAPSSSLKPRSQLWKGHAQKERGFKRRDHWVDCKFSHG